MGIKKLLKMGIKKLLKIDSSLEDLLEHKFINTPSDFGISKKRRREILERLKNILNHVPSGTTYCENLALFIVILETPISAKGDLIECGAFLGGSSCGLSIMTKEIGEKLVICDSFQGLPEPKESNIYTSTGIEYEWKSGAYCGTIQEVKENLKKYGEPEVCEFISGFFNRTLSNSLKGKRFMFAFIDVDLYESMIECLKHVYPRLSEGAKFYTHESQFPSVIDAFYDETWWRNQFSCQPPRLVGDFGRLFEQYGIVSNLTYTIRRKLPDFQDVD